MPDGQRAVSWSWSDSHKDDSRSDLSLDGTDSPLSGVLGPNNVTVESETTEWLASLVDTADAPTVVWPPCSQSTPIFRTDDGDGREYRCPSVANQGEAKIHNHGSPVTHVITGQCAQAACRKVGGRRVGSECL